MKQLKYLLPSILFIFFYALFLRLAVLFFVNPIYDDAFIVFRIARNIAEGNGYVFNMGEKLLVPTSQLYTIICSALYILFKDSFILASRIIGGIADSIIAVFIFIFTFNALKKLFKANEKNEIKYLFLISTLPAIFYASISTTLLVSVHGLETSLYGLSIAFTFYLFSKGKYSYSFIFAGIAVLFRPDGILVIFVLLIFFVFQKKYLPIKELTAFIICIVPYIIFSFFYFGTIIPQSIIAKSLVERDSITEFFKFIGKFYFSINSILFGLLSILGFIYIFNKNSSLLALSIWGLCYALIFSFFGSWWPWYYPPYLIVYAVSIGLGFGVILIKLYYIRYGLFKFVFVPLLIISFLPLFRSFEIAVQNYGSYDVYNEQKKAISMWLNKNTKIDDVITIEPLGGVSFYSPQSKFADYPGLASKKVTATLAQLNRKVGGSPMDYEALAKLIGNVKPSYVILRQNEYENGKSGLLLTYDSTITFLVDSSYTKKFPDLQNMIILKRKH